MLIEPKTITTDIEGELVACTDSRPGSISNPLGRVHGGWIHPSAPHDFICLRTTGPPFSLLRTLVSGPVVIFLEVCNILFSLPRRHGRDAAGAAN